MTEPLLQVEDLHAYYGASHVIHGIGFDLEVGGGLALLGRNGAGKSTTLRAVMGLLPGAQGSVRLAGRELDGVPAHRRSRQGLAIVFEDRRIIPGLTVDQNIDLAARRAAAGAMSSDAVYDLFPKLATMRHHDGGHLSGGEQQMLAIARAVRSGPKVLLLDEPSEGLAPRIVEDLVDSIADLRRDLGIAIVVAEHKQWFSREVTDNVGVLAAESGRLAFHGTWDEFDADPAIAENYLSLGRKAA